jgi:hypothetical protein
LTRNNKTFVAVVVQDATVVLKVRLRQNLGDPFHDEVANRIGMAQPFAFDNLNIGFAWQRAGYLLHVNRLH